MNHDSLVAAVYEDIHADRVEAAVMGCVRISRMTKDYLNAAFFLRELYPDKKELFRTLYDDAPHLKKEAWKFLSDKSLERWLEVHTLDFVLSDDDDDKPDGDKRNVLSVAVGEIDPELKQWESTLSEMTLPAGMDPFDNAAFTDRAIRSKAEIRLRIKALQTIRTRLKAKCLNYAIQMEKQLATQGRTENFLESVQSEVNNFFKARSEDVFRKLTKAAELAASTELEDASLLLTEVRRALKAAADFFYPPVAGMVTCSDGVARLLGDNEYLNRLQEFLAKRVDQSTAGELLKTELEHFVAFTRRLNEMASKGVHASATLAESKQGLVSLYFFLFNVSQHVAHKG